MNIVFTWYQLIKLGNISKIRQDINIFWRGNIIRVLAIEGWFKYLDEPKNILDILKYFDYSDEKFLKTLLDILVKDKTLSFANNEYTIIKPLNTTWVLPSVFDDRMKDLWWEFADFIPLRLKGKYYDFSGGFSLFNWDNILSNTMYSQIRKSAFAFVNGLKKSGNFLDIGSGNGYGTTAIWSLFLAKNAIDKIKIIGLEQDTNLLDISVSEFERMAKKITGLTMEEIKEKSETYPKFIQGSVLNIPFEDNYFDVTYASQVLHWTDAKTAIKEMIRVTKKNGLIFGTQNFYPMANPYNDIHFKVIKGAEGFFSQSDLVNWCKELGIKNIKFATPISIFKIINNKKLKSK
jgi:ubiquinone/menaquinone biosynthesis C-methylase UbiE